MLNVIFDATVLTNIFYKTSSRSGIFFASYNLLKEMLNQSNVSISLYVSPLKCVEGVKLRDEFFPNLKLVYEIGCFKKMYIFNSWLWKQHSYFYAKVPIRKFISFCILLTQFILRFVAARRMNAEILSAAKVFFSPVHAIPNVIRKKMHSANCIFLYDAIPYKFPNFYPSGPGFLEVIRKTSSDQDLYFFDSQSAYNDFKQIFGFVNEKNSAVAYLAANSSFSKNKNTCQFTSICQKYGLPKGKRYVFSLCTLEPRKNLIRALKSFIIFVKQNEINDLVWVLGGGHWDSFITQLNNEMKNIEDFDKLIVKAGYVDDEDLSILYSNAEWFVYTSQYEGFGLPPLEAMQCGCPVITSNNSSLPEVVGDAGIMIDWDSDEQHICAYKKYYYDEKFRLKMAAKGLERAKLFSWQNTVNVILDKISKVGIR